MSVAPLVEELVGKGVRLSVEGGELKCHGPKSALTTEVVARLKAHKAEVIAHLRPAPTRPPKATLAAVERILAAPPGWIAGSYLRGYRDGHSSLAALAYAVVAELKIEGHDVSPYDDDFVDEVMDIMRGLGYPDGCASPPFEHALTDFGRGDERSATWT
jgi:hypothetical protein